MRTRGRLPPFLRIQQIAADDFDLIPNQTDDVGRIDFDGAAVDHHVNGMLESFPDIVGLVHVFFGELGESACQNAGKVP